MRKYIYIGLTRGQHTRLHTRAHTHTVHADDPVCGAYMLNTRSGEYNTGFYSRCSLFCEHMNLEYVRVPVIYRVNQTEYVIRILVCHRNT